MNELNRYERLYSTLASPYSSMFFESKELIPSIAEKAIKDNIVTMQIKNAYALNLLQLRNFVQN